MCERLGKAPDEVDAIEFHRAIDLIDGWTEGREKLKPGEASSGPAVKPSIADLQAIFGAGPSTR